MNRSPTDNQTAAGPQTTALAARTPLDLIALATDRGVGADELGKYLELYKAWEADEARKAFAVAMVAAQADMPTVLTDKENTHTRSRYARLETIIAQCKPVWSRHGFSLSFGTADSPLKLPAPPPKNGEDRAADRPCVRIVCDVRHARGHCEQYHIDLPMDGIGPKGEAIGGMNAPQAMGSTAAYGQRYIVKMVFSLTIAGEDNDAVSVASVVTAEQATEVRQAVREAGKDEAKFLVWAGVERIEDMSVSTYQRAMRMLKKNGGAK